MKNKLFVNACAWLLGVVLAALPMQSYAQTAGPSDVHPMYTPAQALQNAVPANYLGTVLPKTIAASGTATSSVIFAYGWTKIVALATLNQTGTLTITRYLDDAGTIQIPTGAVSTKAIVANTPAALEIADGHVFRTFTVAVTNTSVSSSSLTLFNIYLDSSAVGGADATSTVTATNFPATVDTNTGASSASTLRIVSASNDPVVTTLASAIIPIGLLSSYSSNAFTNTLVPIKPTPGAIDWIDVHNPDTNGNNAYVQCFDLAVGSVTLGTTPPKFSFFIPAGGGKFIPFPYGLDQSSFQTAITCAATTTYGGLTAPLSPLEINLLFK